MSEEVTKVLDVKSLPDLPKSLGPFLEPSWQDGASLLARIEFFGVPHHAIFFRVKRDEQRCQVVDAGEEDLTAQTQWIDACGLYDGAFETVDLTAYGLAGEWVIVIHPYGE